MKYRSEIDGLRAVAVVPVILFHAGFQTFSGGFVGVDIFFVISGFLITTILINDIERGDFSILKFYERRARRILPALFFVMLCCIPFAWMWMLPNQMKDFSQSLVAVSLFVSNILFWKEDDYFGAASEEKPLLHTWSLAVEEQYYILFPIFLLLAWRFGRNRVFWSIVIFASISLLLSEWSWRNAPTANFYLAPARAWELFAGSIAAFIVQKRGVQKNEFLSLLGLVFIVFSIFFYDENTPFPSLYALLPVLGVVFVILFAKEGTMTARFLSTKAFVGVGLISYSAYLWHQPLFAFARIRSLHEPNPYLMVLLAIISLGLAVLSWRYVEQPFRAGKNTAFKKQSSIFTLSAVGLAAFLSFGLWGHVQQGFNSRVDDKIIRILSQTDNRESRKCDYSLAKNYQFPSEKCENVVPNDNGKVLLLGDSHSAAISSEVIDALNAEKISVYTATYSGCVSLLGFRRFDRGQDYRCSEFVEDALSYAQDIGVDTIVLTARFPLYYSGKRYNNGEGGQETGRDIILDIESVSRSRLDSDDRRSRVISELERRIISLSHDFKLVLVSPIPENGWNVLFTAAKRTMFNNDSNTNVSSSYDNYLKRSKPIRDLFDRIEREVDHVRVANVQDGFCDAGTGRCVAFVDGRSLYYDDDHLSIDGARIAAGIIYPAVMDLRR